MPKTAPKGTTLAFDFGLARIGVAQGDAEVGLAHPLRTLQVQSKAQYLAAIEVLIKEWQPRQLVVGLPLHMDGTEHGTTVLCRRFAQRLQRRFQLPVYGVDERLSSVVAESLLAEAQVFGRKQKALLDQVAAQAILYTFFEQGAKEHWPHTTAAPDPDATS